MKNNNFNQMHPVYRSQRAAVASSIETTSGLPYMHDHLDGMSDAQFEHIQHKRAPNWATASQETVAKSLAKAPFNLGGSAYKKAHRTSKLINRRPLPACAT